MEQDAPETASDNYIQKLPADFRAMVRLRAEQARAAYRARIQPQLSPGHVFQELKEEAKKKHGSLSLINWDGLEALSYDLIHYHAQSRSKLELVIEKIQELWLAAGPILAHLSSNQFADIIQRSGYPVEQLRTF